MFTLRLKCFGMLAHTHFTHTSFRFSRVFAEKTHDDLARIAQWLSSSGYHTDYMQVYAKIRSANVVKTIEA